MGSYKTSCFLYFLIAHVFTITIAACPKIVSRDEWGARRSLAVDHLIKPVEFAIIQHTVTPECMTKEQCIERIFNTQIFHMEDLEYDDIGYNFLIGSDGNIYEGVGWSKIGAHTYGYNSRSIGIAFIGNFNDKNASPAAIEACKRLIDCGVSLGVFNENVKLVAARQVQQTRSPGLRLYREIKTWRRWVGAP